MRIVPFFVLVLAASPFACSSDPAPAAADAATDASADGKGDPDNCVPPGTKPNEKGMGGYCDPGGHQCDTAGPGGGPRICTADVPDTPAHGWFCTYPCSTDGECGTGAYCASDPKGKGCVPTVCKKLSDAGTDSARDAPASDAPASDAPSEAAPSDGSDGG